MPNPPLTLKDLNEGDAFEVTCHDCGHKALLGYLGLIASGVEPTTTWREIAGRAKCKQCGCRSPFNKIRVKRGADRPL